jgi:hypothetical protein
MGNLVFYILHIVATCSFIIFIEFKYGYKKGGGLELSSFHELFVCVVLCIYLTVNESGMIVDGNKY